ncbi:Presilphiperfolan-8-beta-ol synthase [Apiospora rasikravindrae]|uniref:Terpene synthase n=1 Tax=Apiospora rasikravindrae TaxID=990691 RepID=A0ABR1SZ83_9PEZI
METQNDEHGLIPSGTFSLTPKDDIMEVLIPDLFRSILSVDPVQNPNYEQVKKEADRWIAKTLAYGKSEAYRNSRADFAYLVSWWAPHCDAEALRTMVDWQHWFDEGYLKDDVFQAAKDIIQTLSILDDSYPLISRDENPLAHAFQVSWQSFKKRASPQLQHRYKDYIKHYMLGVLGQVHARQFDVATLSIDDYMYFRRRTIGVMPCTVLVEYALGIDLPDHVINHQSLKDCREVAVDLKQGEELSIIGILRAQGLSLQDAMDEAGRMLDACYQRWHNAVATMPSWGPVLDRRVLMYLDGLRNIVLGSLLWSFWTGRYFDKEEGRRVRETRVLGIPIRLGTLKPSER